jgi:hypothetical protein
MTMFLGISGKSRSFDSSFDDFHLRLPCKAFKAPSPRSPIKVTLMAQNSGPRGYEYFDGQFVSEAAFDAAVAKGATPLNFYKGLDVRQQPWRDLDWLGLNPQLMHQNIWLQRVY